ncbi:MAG: methyl-accepting chemotaxis protein [Desulfobacterales bacterium]|nr:methyl-accepting chemotaxis protein [Desulfobacterales bacterium]
MIKISLQVKSFLGYFAMIFLIVIVGTIAIIQFKYLADRINYLTKDVGDKVRFADEIEFTILLMESAVEKFIYLNKEEYNKVAEENIQKIIRIISQAKEKQIIKTDDETKQINEIEVILNKYVEKYRNIAIRYKARSKNKSDLLGNAQSIRVTLEKITSNPDVNNDGKISELWKTFIITTSKVEAYLLTYESTLSDTPKKELSALFKNIEKIDSPEIEDVKISIEDFIDDFDGIISVSNKTDEEIKKDILPLAPQIITLARNISSSGWNEMDKAEIEVTNEVSSSRNLVVILIIASIIFGTFIAILSSNQITRPIYSAIKGIIKVADGDLTTRIKVKTKDEVGQLASSFNLFVQKLQGIIKDFNDKAISLNLSSKDLSNLSSIMSKGVKEISQKSDTVASSAKEMSGNMSFIAESMDKVSNNINTVADSVKQTTSTINNIATNSEKANKFTKNAVLDVKNAVGKIETQGIAAQEIGNVTETITDISEQTNLLALNATIEAARAGDYGKGFGVVANEIKELSRQTAEATSEIKTKVSGIQSSFSETARQIHKIESSINDVNELVSSIAGSVEEQSLTTKSISEHIDEVSNSIGSVNKNVSNGSNFVEIIAKDISEVNVSLKDLFASSSKVSKNADELLLLSDVIKEMVNKFKM